VSEETIKRFIKEAHDNAIKKGFYDCPECGWLGRIDSEPLEGVGRMIQMTKECPSCGGLKIDPNKNIGELLMLIVSELGEALEAHRCGRFADWDNYNIKYPISKYDKTERFEKYIKDTFEDEIADVFIRIFDLCGYQDRKLMILSSEEWITKSDNIGRLLLEITKYVCNGHINEALNGLIQFCDRFNIPIEKHIEAKMAYNRTRPHKHGKKY